MKNKKIKGAEVITYDGVTFKSRLEKNCYVALQESGLQFEYEPDVIEVLKETRMKAVWLYESKKINGEKFKRLVKSSDLLQKIKYTPDFKLVLGNLIVYVDSKGYANDVFPYKKKMFVQHLENLNDGYLYIFAIPSSLKLLKELIVLIKNINMNLEIIKRKLNCLNAKDLKLAKQFIEEAKYEDLHLLVTSALYKREKLLNNRGENLDDNLRDIAELAIDIKIYNEQIYG